MFEFVDSLVGDIAGAEVLVVVLMVVLVVLVAGDDADDTGSALHCFGCVSDSLISTVLSFVVRLNSASSCEPVPKQHSGMLKAVCTVLVFRCTFSPSV